MCVLINLIYQENTEEAIYLDFNKAFDKILLFTKMLNVRLDNTNIKSI